MVLPGEAHRSVLSECRQVQTLRTALCQNHETDQGTGISLGAPMTNDSIASHDDALAILAQRLLEAERERDYLADEIARALEECGDTREIILEYALKVVRPKVTQ
jgi:hypothetical protein